MELCGAQEADGDGVCCAVGHGRGVVACCRPDLAMASTVCSAGGHQCCPGLGGLYARLCEGWATPGRMRGQRQNERTKHRGRVMLHVLCTAAAGSREIPCLQPSIS